MADFLKSKEIPQVPVQETDPLDQQAEQKETKVLEFPEIQQSQQQETEIESQKIPEQTGSVIPLSERIAEQNPETKTERQQDIEKILSKELGDIYGSLSSEQQEKVKIQGEKAAKEIEKLIEEMIETRKDVSRKILEEIRDWMSEIPGVNKFFLAQESKRKTDHMLALARKSEQIEIEKAA
ncbi:hypothetical protein KKF64_00095 [Patescibacteria group bacterium]|nr:hypothetical protein [Patescibacteria group bacterium]